jgi:alpha-D-ribose 1-methylphosphonate 5-phosphate C-P lyase
VRPGALRPVAELHPLDKCAWCGADDVPLRRVVLRVTQAEAVLCEDVVLCARRQLRHQLKRKWGLAA